MRSNTGFPTAALVAVAMVTSSTAAAAASVPTRSLTASLAASCATSAAVAGAAVAAQTPTRPGCVLPVADAPAPVVDTTPLPVAEPVYETRAGGFNFLLPLLGLAALGGLAFLLLDDDDDEDEALSAG